MLAEVSATGRRPSDEELDALRDLGEHAAGAGYGLGALLGALAAARAALGGRAAAPGPLPTVVERAVDAVAEGHGRAARLAERQEEAARREFLDALLLGHGAPGPLAEHADRFGLRPAPTHTVAVARARAPYADGGPEVRRLERALAGTALLAVKEGRLICVAPGDDEAVPARFARLAHAGAGPGGLVATGRPHPGPGGAAASYAEALRALDLADRLGLDGPLLRAADLLVYPVLTRDRAALADLVLTVLGPLRSGRGGAVPLLETLTAYFDAGCVSAEAARRLDLSVRALTYRLERIHSLTGHNPANPAHRYTLQTATLGSRLLNWPTDPLP
ncbi:PucR family transcriptional regulator [Streptomyces katrae]|uniref:Regulator n=1 Tax=Streptomyces katrae TaxID=68223 RepID=A0A0F4JZG8_9ACTN|nr:helix-turn-helix domain-containing protein [Streptomyces katrae]KJY39108.1 regulator [Streptomyces katrae]